MEFVAQLFWLIPVIFALFFLMSAVKAVPQGQEWTVEQFGKYSRTLKPGLNVIVPVYERIGLRLVMMEQVLDIPRQDVITKDNAMVTTDAIAFFQVIDAARAAYEVLDVKKAISNITLTNVRTVIGSMDLDEVLSKRDEINERLLRVVDAATSPWGVKILRIEIKDLQPPADISESMARQMKAEREKRAAILEAEGLRAAEILRAEGEKQAAVLEAEGRREAAFKDAEARERLAEAEAKATMMVSQAIAKGDVQAINYFVADKYTQALKAMATSPNQKLLMLPMDAMGLMGSLAGIAEIAKDSFAQQKQPRPVPPRGEG